MLRCALLTAAVLAAAPAARADGPLADGKWLLLISPSATFDQAMCVLQIETKDGKPAATVLADPAQSVKEFKVDGKTVTVTFSSGFTFTGIATAAGQPILGNFSNGQSVIRAKLAPTDKEMLTQADRVIRIPAPEPLAKVEQFGTRLGTLTMQARREQDADKKKDLQKQVLDAQAEADKQLPGLYREVVEKHSGTPAALEAAQTLLGNAAKWQVPPDEAAKLMKILEAGAQPYGLRYARFVMVRAAEALVNQKGLEAIALDVTGPLFGKLTDADPKEFQVQILTVHKKALEAAGKKAEAAALDGRLAQLEAALDAEYLATVPPFVPTPFAGRKQAGANKVVVLELFTGAQCPPCVAADIAFDALEKSYKPSELVLIQYHMHIPGPDPLTNPDTIARFDYYRERFPQAVGGTPTTVFNGKPQAGGGGGMANSEGKYKQYRAIIDPLLDETTPVRVSGKAMRTGDKIAINIEVNGAPAGDDLRVRLLVIEETIRYVGGNRLRFHHHVVRAMPGGSAGAVVTGAEFKHAATADVSEVRAALVKYLDGYAVSTRPFPYPARPLEMKHLKVIALVQSDKTGEVVQAAEIAVEDGPAAGGAGGR
jgi:hypothetical protein